MRSALIIDVHNLYIGTQRNFPGRSINYAEVVGHFDRFGNNLFFKIAYGRQPEEKVPGFAKALRKLGFDLRFGVSPYAIDLALTVAGMVHRQSIDHLVIGSVAAEVLPLFQYARQYGVYTTILGYDIPNYFNEFGSGFSIPPEFLLSETADGNDLSTDSTRGSVGTAA